jgi:hypothetical protein
MQESNRVSVRGVCRLWAGAVATATLLLLGGCDGLWIGGMPPAPAGRPLNVGSDGLAALVVALDLPPDVQPIENATRAELDISSSRGSRQVKSLLVLADGDGIDGALPPLGVGHTYYLLGFSLKDQAALAAAQKWLAALPAAAAPTSAFTVTPKLCTLGPLDPTASFSVEAALPDQPPLAPLLGPEPVTALTGGAPPPCRSG